VAAVREGEGGIDLRPIRPGGPRRLDQGRHVDHQLTTRQGGRCKKQRRWLELNSAKRGLLVVRLQLIELPGQVCALPPAELASKSSHGGALDRQAERLLLVSGHRYQRLAALVAACQCAGGLVYVGEAVHQRVAGLRRGGIGAGEGVPEGAVCGERRQDAMALAGQVLLFGDGEPAAAGRGSRVGVCELQQQVQDFPGCAEGERSKAAERALGPLNMLGVPGPVPAWTPEPVLGTLVWHAT
jgi:hypothetical protein